MWDVSIIETLTKTIVVGIKDLLFITEKDPPPKKKKKKHTHTHTHITSHWALPLYFSPGSHIELVGVETTNLRFKNAISGANAVEAPTV